jgi:hypothetical protein
MIVMMIAITPSLKAFKRSFPISDLSLCIDATAQPFAAVIFLAALDLQRLALRT